MERRDLFFFLLWRDLGAPNFNSEASFTKLGAKQMESGAICRQHID